jgi:uncharacterized integral membrane protein
MANGRDGNDDASAQGWRETRGGIDPRVIVAGVVALLLLAFIAQNTRQVPVKWLFFDATTSLWFVILVAAVLGAVASNLVQWWWGRRRGRD